MVSRTAVREAVIALEVQDVLEVRIGSGIYVRETPVASPRALRGGGSRARLNCCAHAVCSKARSPARPPSCEKTATSTASYAALAEMRDHRDDKRVNEAADLKFHQCIAEATGNVVLVQMVTALWDQLRGPIWSRLEAHFHTPALREASLNDHQKVFRAIASRDAQPPKPPCTNTSTAWWTNLSKAGPDAPKAPFFLAPYP